MRIIQTVECGTDTDDVIADDPSTYRAIARFERIIRANGTPGYAAHALVSLANATRHAVRYGCDVWFTVQNGPEPHHVDAYAVRP